MCFSASWELILLTSLAPPHKIMMALLIKCLMSSVIEEISLSMFAIRSTVVIEVMFHITCSTSSMAVADDYDFMLSILMRTIFGFMVIILRPYIH